MCGICGFTGDVADKKNVIKNMTDAIAHRGPDSEGFFTDENIAMGFRRLSVIDLKKGEQPVYNEDKTLALTFNGEIYNYKQLREALVKKGHTFCTESVGEVIVHGFEEWKEDLLPKLRGMFAFAVYNTVDNSVFIARDFFGIKSIHYAQIGNDLVYATEIKSILQYPKFVKKFNMKALDAYLSYQYVVPPETFFEGVYCLMPGYYLWFKDGELETTRYWEARFMPQEDLTEAEAIDAVERVVEDSVNIHKIGDVEAGSFLSGGLNSNYISNYFEDGKTFTVGFDYDEKYNEIESAKMMSKEIGTEHHAHLISSEEFWDAVPTVQYYMDQPLADPTGVAFYFASKLASEYVRVVLSGEGADELFGGYSCYHDPRRFKIYQTIVPHCVRKAIRALCKKLPDNKCVDYLINACDPLEERYIGNASMYDCKEKKELLKNPAISRPAHEYARKFYYRCRKYDDVTKMQYLDINLWMVGNVLLKADRMTAANSLELRLPFLDKEVFKVAGSLPTKFRVNKQNTKYALRKAASRHISDSTDEAEKQVFPVPVSEWLKDEKYYNVIKTKITGKTAEKFFNTEVMLRLLDEHFGGTADNARKIWTVYVFLVWYDIYFDEDAKTVEKPVNHLEELKAVAEARREKQLDAPGEVIMAAAEAVSDTYKAPDFDKEDEAVAQESATEAEAEEESVTEEEVTSQDVATEEENTEVQQEAQEIEPIVAEEPALQETESAIAEEEVQTSQPQEEQAEELALQEEYVNISNPEDDEIYEAPRKPRTPQEELEMAIEAIEKRSKYLDEPNVISDEALSDALSSISFFPDDDDEVDTDDTTLLENNEETVEPQSEE